MSLLVAVAVCSAAAFEVPHVTPFPALLSRVTLFLFASAIAPSFEGPNLLMRLDLVAALFMGVVAATGTPPKALKKRVCSKRSVAPLPAVTQCTATVLVSTITETATESASGVVIYSTVTEVETTTTTPGVVVSTLTATETSVAVETAYETTTAVETLTSHITAVETITSHVTETTIALSTTTATETTTAISTAISTETVLSIQPTTVISVSVSPTTILSTVTAAAAPLVTNGNFEGNTYDGWSILSRTGTQPGSTVSVISGGVGGRYALSISASYFVSAAPAGVTVGTPINCVQGIKYRILGDVSIVSSYVNNLPWSITVGSTTGNVYSGAGSSLAWTSISYVHTCGSTPESNTFKIAMTAQNNRAGTLYFDNLIVAPLSA